jgi:hypothetical protein
MHRVEPDKPYPEVRKLSGKEFPKDTPTQLSGAPGNLRPEMGAEMASMPSEGYDKTCADNQPTEPTKLNQPNQPTNHQPGEPKSEPASINFRD